MRVAGQAACVEEDPDVTSVLQLRQQIAREWPEGDKKDVLLAALDGLLLERREQAQAARADS